MSFKSSNITRLWKHRKFSGITSRKTSQKSDEKTAVKTAAENVSKKIGRDWLFIAQNIRRYLERKVSEIISSIVVLICFELFSTGKSCKWNEIKESEMYAANEAAKCVVGLKIVYL